MTPEQMHTLERQFQAVRAMPPPFAKNQRHLAKIDQVKAGGYIRFDGKTYMVESVSSVQETSESFKKNLGYQCFELKLFCLETGETVYLEWERDDEIIVYVTTAQVKFRDLLDDEGKEVDGDDLDQICEDEDSVYYQGREYAYEDDWAGRYCRNGGKESEKAFFYEFEAANGTCLTIEEWVVDGGDEEYQIFLSQRLNPASIEVLVPGKEEG